MITVWCVLWGDKYHPEYVHRLKYQVAKNLSLEHEFKCITDHPLDDVDCVKPIVDWPGWWQKLSVFKPGLTSGLNLLMDIDVVIVGELDSVVKTYGTHTLSAPRDWSKGTLAAPFVLWTPSVQTEEIWNRFTTDVMQRKSPGGKQYGDQNWMDEVCGDWWTEIEPPTVCSYKWHCRGQKLPPNGARVVCFHGKPDYPDCPEHVNGWIAEALL